MLTSLIIALAFLAGGLLTGALICGTCKQDCKVGKKEGMMVSEQTSIIERTAFIGDSWISAYVAGGSVNGGWPLYMGGLPKLRMGISGSTAKEWAEDKDGRLSLALALEEDYDTVIISLMGNDAFAALQDGHVSTAEVLAAISNMRKVVKSFTRLKKRVFVLQYSSPFYPGNKRFVEGGKAVGQINSAIEVACHFLPVEFIHTPTALLEEHFDGTDIHPNEAGHKALADYITQKICWKA